MIFDVMTLMWRHCNGIYYSFLDSKNLSPSAIINDTGLYTCEICNIFACTTKRVTVVFHGKFSSCDHFPKIFKSTPTLQWRERHGVWNHPLFTSLFRLTPKRTSKFRIAGHSLGLWGNLLVIGGFPSQGASNAESVSISWRQYGVVFDMVFPFRFRWRDMGCHWCWISDGCCCTNSRGGDSIQVIY